MRPACHLDTQKFRSGFADDDNHGLSQHGVWVSFWTPKPLKSTPQDTKKMFVRNFIKMSIKHKIESFHHHIILMTLYKDIMPYFDKYIHVYG